MTRPTAVLEREQSGGRTPPVDPRLRARRIEVKRAEGRRRLHRLVVLVTATALAAGGWAAVHSSLLDLDRVEVVAGENLAAEEIIRASGAEIGDALVYLDAGAMRRSIEELPWVERAWVSRSWRGTLSIEVRERLPVAVIAAAGTPGSAEMLVDLSGQVIGPVPAGGWTDLARIEGIEAPPAGGSLDDAARRAVELAAGALPLLTERMSVVTLDTSGELWVDLRDDADVGSGGRVRFGDGRDLREQLVAAETILANVELSCLAVIDVRVAASPVVTRLEACS